MARAFRRVSGLEGVDLNAPLSSFGGDTLADIFAQEGIRFNPSARRQRWGPGTQSFSPEELVSDAARRAVQKSGLLGNNANGSAVNPFGALRGSHGLTASQIADRALLLGRQSAGIMAPDYDPERGSKYRNYYEQDPVTGDYNYVWDVNVQAFVLPSQTTRAAPAELTVIPTSTTDPMRPRTVAAGFQIDRDDVTDKGKLTVVFRDGTYYNYYDVELATWEAFKASPSKGRFISSVLDSYPRGPARMDAGSDSRVQAMVALAMSTIHRAARAGQVGSARRPRRAYANKVQKTSSRYTRMPKRPAANAKKRSRPLTQPKWAF